MPGKTGADRVMELLSELRDLDSAQTTNKAIAVAYFDNLLSEIDDVSNKETGSYAPIDIYTTEIKKVINALLKPELSAEASKLPCFAEQKVSMAELLQRQGHFAQQARADHATEPQPEKTAGIAI